MQRSVLCGLICLSVCVFMLTRPASAQMRVVTYNVANGSGVGNGIVPRTGMGVVLAAMGNESTGGIARPIDILMLQEVDDVTTTVQDFLNIMNGIYGAGTYARGTVLNDSTVKLHQGVIYNTQTVSLLDEIAFGTSSGSKAARQPMRYEFRPVGYDSTADFYVYNSHYKATTETASQARRLYEAEVIRDNADALGQGQHIIYGGDYNIQSSTEASYQELLSAGNGQAFDPINSPGTWHADPGFAPIHTQSPHDGSDGLVASGMDDRLDFQLVTSEMMDNEGLSYIPGSYHAFGNNGTTYDLAINAPSNTYPLTSSQLDSLAHVSDHLPLVADYQLPAIMQVTVDPIPSRVIAGSAVSVVANVSNAAPVTASAGADELDYTINAIGLLSGGGTGSVNALTLGDDYNLALDTSAAGPVNGQINASSTSEAVQNGTYFQGLSTLVLDPSDASFAAGSDQDVLTIDFGSFLVGGTVNSAFDIFNLEQTPFFTADLDLDSIQGLGDTAVLGSNLAAFTGLTAGSSSAFSATFDTSSIGSFAATYILGLSDEDIPGQTYSVLTLQLLGEVMAVLEGDLDSDSFVGILDLNIVLSNWNQAVTAGDLLAGDPSNDGFVGIEDLNFVLGNWNAGTPPQENAAIPEPGAGCVLLLMGMNVCRRRRL
jgi:endonuclease/exonuclease/phosphatase family metal-dependent hydrolase